MVKRSRYSTLGSRGISRFYDVRTIKKYESLTEALLISCLNDTIKEFELHSIRPDEMLDGSTETLGPKVYHRRL